MALLRVLFWKASVLMSAMEAKDVASPVRRVVWRAMVGGFAWVKGDKG